jgi:hypothetical protein
MNFVYECERMQLWKLSVGELYVWKLSSKGKTKCEKYWQAWKNSIEFFELKGLEWIGLTCQILQFWTLNWQTSIKCPYALPCDNFKWLI